MKQPVCVPHAFIGLLFFWCLLNLTPEASQAGAVRIMPLGDSITDGYGVPGGYRAPLYQMLNRAGFNVVFVGSVTNNSSTSLPDPHHEGHSGYRIDQVTDDFPAWVEAAGNLDVILLDIGTNDYGQNHGPSRAIDRLEQLISEIVAERPTARIVVANLLLRVDNPAADEAIQKSFNPFVRGIVEKHARLGQRVFFVDMRSALSANDLKDGLHPNRTGYDKMAAVWFEALHKMIAPEHDNQSVINFDGASLSGELNHMAIPANYQPIPGLNIGYFNVGIFNQGPDHTTGITGGGHYNTYSLDYKNPQIFVFSRPISILSFWLSTYCGGNDGTSLEVHIKAFADPNGMELTTNLTVKTREHPLGTNYQWESLNPLANIGAKIMRLEFYSDGNAQVDDMAIGIPADSGPLRAIRFKLPAHYLHPNLAAQLKTIADYAYSDNVDVTADPGVVYSSSDTNIFRVSRTGLLYGLNPGIATLTAAWQSCSCHQQLTVERGVLMDFNTGLEALTNRALLPPDYQPVPGIRIGYDNVGIFNGGPDHTSDVLGGNHFNTYQFKNDQPQVFIFNLPVSVPSLWLATFAGSQEPVKIKVYSDPKGVHCLGSVEAPTARSEGAGSYIWTEYTNLDDVRFNGQIRRLEFATSSDANANLDDMTIIPNANLGPIRSMSLELPVGDLFPGMSAQAKMKADFEKCGEAELTSSSGATFSSTAPNVVDIDTSGRVRFLGPGRATLTATLANARCSNKVVVLPGRLVDFALPAGEIGNFVAIPDDYQPLPGVVIGYDNVGLFNGGPDHTTGLTDGNHYNSYQLNGSMPQVFTFNVPVSIPALFLATYSGSGDQVSVSAYADKDGTDLLGSIFFTTIKSGGAGSYFWAECTNLDSMAFNGLIRRIEFSSPDNANLDDMVVKANTQIGPLQNITLSLPLRDFLPGMSRPAKLSANCKNAGNYDLTENPGVVYGSSDQNIATVSQNGLVKTISPGRATITAQFQDQASSVSLTVRPLSGILVSFNDLPDLGSKVPLPASYQPVPGLKLSYENVGIYNGGPDHTAGVKGGTNYNTYQYEDGKPQVFMFSEAVSLPSFWLSTYWGSGDLVSISAFGDESGKNLLGTIFVSTSTFPGPGNYQWIECTNLNAPAFNGLVRRLELLGNTGNVQLDDMIVSHSIEKGSVSISCANARR